MTDLDEAMQEHIAYLVLFIKRPFCYKDLLLFEVDGIEYRMKHGTFRNKVSRLRKEGKVEIAYASNLTFYTLKGHKFGKPMTPDRMGVRPYNDITDMFQNLPLDKQSIHDIRLKFNVLGIWKIFSSSSDFYKIKRSLDIVIPAWNKDNAIIKVTIHKTDVVSVIIGCSLKPIPLDFNGLIHFFTLLVRIEERLNSILEGCSKVNVNCNRILIPQYKSWIITLWHFGRDSLIEYDGEKFSITVQNAENIMTRVYAKDFGNGVRLRGETQEYPNKSVFDAINEKISR